MRQRKIRAVALLLVFIFIMTAVGCKGNSGDNNPTTVRPNNNQTTEDDGAGRDVMTGATEFKVTVDESKTYQTIESFGASGAWWSQIIGGATRMQKKVGLETREYIAQLLFGTEMGIGLTNYRYNLGGGSQEGDPGDIGDKWRRAECFETAPGEYDWTKDANAVWFLKRAVELGVKDVVFFVNSPIERLTKNGLAHGSEGAKSNLAPENYEEFAKYVLDVTEHFIDEGIPVKSVSPINEPQWDWLRDQEGCHYEPSEMVATLKVFIEKIKERDKLKDVEIAAFDSGAWESDHKPYTGAILRDEELREYFKTIDCHSYWTSMEQKKSFMTWMQNNGYDDVTLKMSEWCEMENGKDLTMDSAINLATVMHEDLTILNVTSWQYWIAVSCYDYRDGLIYITKTGEVITIPKRLWSMGNYSKYVRPGYVRTDAVSDNANVLVSSYKGTNDAGKEQTVIVLVNKDKEKNLKFDISGIAGTSTDIKVYATDEIADLVDATAARLKDGNVALSAESVTTVVITR